MKILFKSYNTCCQNNNGGVQVRLRKIRELLINKGVKTDLFNEFETNVGDYDVLHLFKLEPENCALIKCAKARGVKVVISTIVNLSARRKVKLFQMIKKFIPFSTLTGVTIESLQLADGIIVETIDEAKMMEECYGIKKDKIKIIPNGIEVNEYSGNDIYDVIGNHEKYVLQVGRFNKNKNQLNVIKALRGTNITMVFAGGPDFRNMGYYEECIKAAEGSNNIFFLGWLDGESSLLKSAYANADTVIIPSYEETFGLVVLEAGITGAKVIMSNRLPILSFPTFEGCITFDPNKIEDIKSAVEEAVKLNRNDELKKRIIADFSWDKIIDEHISFYEELVGNENCK